MPSRDSASRLALSSPSVLAARSLFRHFAILALLALVAATMVDVYFSPRPLDTLLLDPLFAATFVFYFWLLARLVSVCFFRKGQPTWRFFLHNARVFLALSCWSR